MRARIGALVWLAIVLASTALFAFAFSRGWAELAVFIVPAAIIVILVGLERWLPARPGRDAIRDPRVFHDLGHSALANGVAAPLGEILFVGAAAWMAGEMSARFGANLWPTHGPVLVQGLGVVLLADGLDYWRHRIEHRHPLLWRVHSLHHSMNHLHVLKSGRNHGLDMAFRSLAVFAPLALIGVPGELLLWYAAAVTVFGPLAHANLDVELPDFVHHLVLTPGLHRIHHARDLELANHNFVNVFPIWDRLFGSYRHPEDRVGPEAGIEEDPLPSGFVAQLLAPFRGSYWRVPASTRLRPASLAR